MEKNKFAALNINEETLTRTGEQIAAQNKLTEGRPAYYLVGPRCLSENDQGILRSIVDRDGAQAEVISEGGQRQVSEVRRTRVCWLDYERHSAIYRLVWTIANTANELLRYDIFSVPERIQLTVYDAGEEGYFTWHMDTVPSDMTRKISISIPLNDSSECRGGVMELHQGASVIEVEQDPGVPIIFPSWLPHRITPVTQGKRYSLVAWVRGPNWR